MDTIITHDGITVDLQMYEEPRLLSDGTWAHPVRVRSRATLKDLERLVGLRLWGLPVTGFLPERGVENQSGQTVGLVLAERKW